MTLDPKPPTDHARHDRLVVVRYLDRDPDLLTGEVNQARALLASCPDCAGLATELQLISDATSRMLAPARPRDFRLTPEQAAALGSGGLRRFLEAAGSAFRFGFLRPLAGAAVAIGLLLAVVGSLPNLSAGTSALPAADTSSHQQTVAGHASSAPAALATAAPSTSAWRDMPSAYGPAATSAALNGSESATPSAINTSKFASPDGSAQMATGPSAQPGDSQVSPSPGNGSALVPGSTLPGVQRGSVTSVSGAETTRASESISPLVVLGALLATVGLVVIALNFVARRIGRNN